MKIQPILFNTAKSIQPNRTSVRQSPAFPSPASPDTAIISEEARSALASSGKMIAESIEARLAEIKAKDAIEKTAEDMKYLLTYDSKYKEIVDKQYHQPGSLTASEIDYMQKTVGFVNTMSALTEEEKQLFDEVVASGNIAAADAIGTIAMLRFSGYVSPGGDSTTTITAENILKYFKYAVTDNIGKADADFQALVTYLENRPSPLADEST